MSSSTLAPVSPPSVLVALVALAALVACGSEAEPTPTPTPSAPPSSPSPPPAPPARTLVEDAKLGGPAENLLADPQFLVPGYRPNAFFVYAPRSQSPKSTLRYAAWDTPFGRRSPALTVAALSEDLALCAVFPASEKGAYRASIWVSGALADGSPAELPQGLDAQIVGAAGRRPIGKLAVTGAPKVVGERTWVEMAGTFTSDPGNDMFLLTVRKGATVLAAAPEVLRATSSSGASAASGEAPAWVARAMASVREAPRAVRARPPRPTR